MFPRQGKVVWYLSGKLDLGFTVHSHRKTTDLELLITQTLGEGYRGIPL